MSIKSQIPKWLIILTVLLGLLGIVVSLVLVFKPENAIQTVDFTAKGVSYLLQMWAARQFAVGFVFLFSVFRKSIPMLEISYLFYLVMNLGDIIIGIYNNDSGLYIGATVMVAISVLVLYMIKVMKKEKASR